MRSSISEAKVTHLCFAALIALAIGGSVSMMFIETDIHDSSLERSQNVIYIAVLFFTLFGFNHVAKKHPKLKIWATNTFSGVVSMLFFFGFLMTLFNNSYMLLPVPSWLHLSISVILGLIASGCMFATFM